MQIHEQKQGDVLIATVHGQVDSATAPTFEAKLLALIDRGERRLVVDGSMLSYLNSAGLKVFLVAAKKLEPLGGKMALCALAPNVLMIFEMIGFTKIMTIVPSREEALRLMADEAAAA